MNNILSVGDDTLKFDNGRWISSDCEIGSNTIVQVGAIIAKDCVIGNNCRIGYNAVLRRETKVGDNSIFGTMSVSEGKNYIGEKTTIHSQCHITAGVHIDDHVFIAPFFCGANTRRIVHGRTFPLEISGYRIERGCRIGICVEVVPGVRIGREVLIDVGSLVTKDIPDFSHIRGRPARIIGEVPESDRLNWSRYR